MTRSRAWAAALATLLVTLALVALVTSPGTPHATPVPGRTASTTPVAGGPGGGALPTISRTSLPPEARTTLDLIATDGPFPYDADGSVYQNRERILPLRPTGSYREYTVETPGSADRGARRIVVAASGESYWTADHYASFARIIP